MATTKMGRESVFSGKDTETRVQGILTKVGGKAFEHARWQLGALYTKIMKKTIAPSDGDVVEFLARGRRDTIGYLKAKRQQA